MDKGNGLINSFRVRIPQTLLEVLRRASNVKMLLHYFRKNAAVVVYSSTNPTGEKTDICFSPGNRTEVEVGVSARSWKLARNIKLY